MLPRPKIAYPAPRAAAFALRRITLSQAARGRSAPVAMRQYEICGAWHLGSQMASRHPARRLQAVPTYSLRNAEGTITWHVVFVRIGRTT